MSRPYSEAKAVLWTGVILITVAMGVFFCGSCVTPWGYIGEQRAPMDGGCQ